MPRDPTREPNGSFWFGAELEPDGCQVWFRITGKAVGRMLAETPSARDQCLVDARGFGGGPTHSGEKGLKSSRLAPLSIV